MQNYKMQNVRKLAAEFNRISAAAIHTNQVVMYVDT